MEEDTEYEILPHEELERLRTEVSEIKKNPLGKKYGSSDLIDSIHKLSDTINSMNDIFASTNQELLDDFKEHSMKQHFEIMTSQNEELARGILSVAQLVQKQTDLLNTLINKMDDMFKDNKNDASILESFLPKPNFKPGENLNPKKEMNAPAQMPSQNNPQNQMPQALPPLNSAPAQNKNASMPPPPNVDAKPKNTESKELKFEPINFG